MLLSYTRGFSLELRGRPEIEDTVTWERPLAELGSDLPGKTYNGQPPPSGPQGKGRCPVPSLTLFSVYNCNLNFLAGSTLQSRAWGGLHSSKRHRARQGRGLAAPQVCREGRKGG